MANISGYVSTVAWFLVLLPQVIRNFRHKTVQGLSLGWAILNFTAAFNNAFFVFKLGKLPWYVYLFSAFEIVTSFPYVTN